MTSQPQHTPEQWTLEYVDDSWLIRDTAGRLIAEVYTQQCKETDRRKLDARRAPLMAAAPDLLEACSVAYEALAFNDHLSEESIESVRKLARAAIAKATKEPDDVHA